MVDTGNARTPAVTKAVVPAAGLGTRFLPATKATPKEMLPVVDKPAIQYDVEGAVAAPLDAALLPVGGIQRARRRAKRAAGGPPGPGSRGPVRRPACGRRGVRDPARRRPPRKP